LLRIIKKFITRKQWRKNKKENLKKIREDSKILYKPMYKYIKHANKLKSPLKAGPLPKGFYIMKFDGIKNEIRMALPNFLDKCYPLKNKHSYVYRCVRSGTHNGLYVIVYPNRSTLDVLKSGKKIFDGIPLPIVRQLKKDKQWEKMKKTLTPDQVKYLHSVQKEKAKCKSYNQLDQAFNRGSYDKCSIFVYDYNYPGQVMGGDIKHYHNQQETIGIYYEAKSDYRSYYSKAAKVASSTVFITPKKATPKKK